MIQLNITPEKWTAIRESALIEFRAKSDRTGSRWRNTPRTLLHEKLLEREAQYCDHANATLTVWRLENLNPVKP